MIKRLTLLFIAALSLSAHAEPKKLLVVTVTTGFRHSSIETAEKVLAELGQKSGAFTVDYVHQPEGQPKNPGKPPVMDEKKDTAESFKAKQETYSKALAEYNEANKAWGDKVKAYMADKMALDKIKGYDGFVFANTTGDLVLPDRDGFIKLIEDGKAFIAMHSGSDTYHPFPGYISMLGGEFETHKSQVEIQPIVHDPAHPITKTVPVGWKVFDEIYIIKSFDKAKVHGLLGLNTHPNLEQFKAEAAQRKEKKIEDPKKDADLKEIEAQKERYFPVSWCKEFGNGRVYYNSLGHREDVWDPTWKADTKDRKNSPEIAQTYQEMILAGIKWTLKLEEGVSTPGNIP